MSKDISFVVRHCPECTQYAKMTSEFIELKDEKEESPRCDTKEVQNPNKSDVVLTREPEKKKEMFIPIPVVQPSVEKKLTPIPIPVPVQESIPLPMQKMEQKIAVFPNTKIGPEIKQAPMPKVEVRESPKANSTVPTKVQIRMTNGPVQLPESILNRPIQQVPLVSISPLVRPNVPSKPAPDSQKHIGTTPIKERKRKQRD